MGWGDQHPRPRFLGNFFNFPNCLSHLSTHLNDRLAKKEGKKKDKKKNVFRLKFVFEVKKTDLQVAFEDGTTTSYALSSSQERGQMFVGPGVEVYKGQIVGIHQRPGDLSLNVCKKKAATNIRSNKEQTGAG